MGDVAASCGRLLNLRMGDAVSTACEAGNAGPLLTSRQTSLSQTDFEAQRDRLDWLLKQRTITKERHATQLAALERRMGAAGGSIGNTNPDSIAKTMAADAIAADSTGNRLPEESALGRQLVQAARDRDHYEVKRLLNAGAPPEAGWVSGYTALGLAANRGHTEIAALLLSRRARPDTPICINDATPLMIAVVWDRRGLIRLLLQHRASLSPRGTSGTYRGCTALDVAHQRGRHEAAALLSRERALRRLEKLRRVAPLVGRAAAALLDLFAAVHFRPGGEGAVRAAERFYQCAQVQSPRPPGTCVQMRSNALGLADGGLSRIRFMNASLRSTLMKP